MNFVKQKNIFVLLIFSVIILMGIITSCDLKDEDGLCEIDDAAKVLADSDGDVGSLNDAFQKPTNEIKKAYIEKYSLRSNLESIHISYIYSFEDAYAIQVTVIGEERPCVVIEEEVNGLIFSYYSGNAVKVYENGKFYSVKDAYKMGVLSESNLKILHNICSTLGYSLNIQYNNRY